MFHQGRLIGLGATLVILAAVFFGWFSLNNGQIGLSQATSVKTVCASGCDFPRIQEAIDAVNAGVTIQVKAGTYKENLTIRNKAGVFLQGAGPDQVILDGNAPQQQDIIPGILIQNSRNIGVSGFRITNSKRGLETDDTSLLYIESNTFDTNLLSGIMLLRSGGGITDNIVQRTQLDPSGSDGQGIIVIASAAKLSNNRITGNADCGLLAKSSNGQQSLAYGSNNTVQDNRGGDLFGNVPTTLLAQPPPDGTLAQVAVPQDVPTLQEAVNRVQSGGTIMVAPGVYQQPVQSGPVQIYKSLKIMGAGPDKTVLKAHGSNWVAVNIATDQLQVTIEGLKVTGGRRGMQIGTGSSGKVTLSRIALDANGSSARTADIAFWIFEQATATLDQVSISGNQGYGIFAEGQARVTVSGSTISQNGGIAVFLAENAEASIQNNTIDDNTYGGITVFLSSQATIDGNTIARNGYEGIFAADSSHAQITNNQITATKSDSQGNAGEGIWLAGNTQVTIEGNTISQNAAQGILLEQSQRATIQKNTIADNGLGGIALEQAEVGSLSPQAAIDDNAITSNTGVGIFLNGSSQATITNNHITDNKPFPQGAGQGIRLSDKSHATILGNTITGNAAGVELYTMAQAEISNNAIQNNHPDCGVFFQPTTAITGQGNKISDNQGGDLCGDTSKLPKGFGGGK